MQKLRTINIGSIMFWLPLFLYAIDFIGQANYIVVMWVVVAMLLSGVSLPRKLNPEGGILLAFCLLYFVFYSINNTFQIQILIRHLLAPWLCYFVAREYCNSQQRVSAFILVVVSSLFFYASITMVLNLRGNYKMGALTTVWNRPMSTTLYGLLLTPMASVCYVGLKFRQKKACILLTILSIVSMYFTLITGRRTLLAVFAFVLSFNILLDIVVDPLRFKIILWVGIIATVLLIGYSRDFLGVRSYIENSLLYERLLLGSKGQLTGRSEVQLAAIRSLGQKLLGSDAALETSYAHNLWLDTFIIGGLFPFFALIAYSLSTIKTLYKAIKKHGTNDFVIRLYLCVFLGLNLAFFVEPILQGAPHVFVLLCAMNGAMSAYANELKSSECRWEEELQ